MQTRRTWPGILLALVLVVFNACAPRSSAEVNVICPSQPEWCEAMKKEFEARYGITVNYVRLATNESLERIRAEKDAPQFDMVWGGPNDSLLVAKTEGLLAPYASPNAANLLDPGKYLDPDNTWAGIYVGTLGFGVNRDWLAAHPGVEPPRAWDDLLKPEFQGQIMMAHPATSGTAYTIVATVLQIKGEEAGWEYLHQLSNQIAQFTKAGAAPAAFVGQGEAAVCIVFAHAILHEIEANQAPLQLTFPADGAGYEIGAMAILQGAQHLDAAQKLYDWSLTAEMQALAPQYGVFQAPTVRGVALTHPEIAAASLIAYDSEWAAAHHDEFVARFIREIAAADNLKQ